MLEFVLSNFPFFGHVFFFLKKSGVNIYMLALHFER
uniref:Uncharacterized protein n=1 Tax=Rhizophora mucronata TaxID=61149 RepID=A0A2P2R0F2_RHIMU